MAKQDKTSKSGFVIKLSSETAQKIAEEEKQAKIKTNEPSTEDLTVKETLKNSIERKQNIIKEKNVLDASRSTEQVTIEKNPTGGPKKDQEDWGNYAPYITYEDGEAVYTDPTTQQKYTWNKTTSSWDSKTGQNEVPGREYSYENDTHIYTEPDGSKFFWDPDKSAWIPKVDDDFLALYQMSYGFIDNTSKESKDDKTDIKKEEPKPIIPTKRKNEPQWFEQSDEKNTKVYVSNLPLDLTEEEFVNLMQKCGLVERDPSTQKMKVKLYIDKEHDCFKGDALCTYIKIESVDLALKLLDGSDYKGQKIKVERAQFQLKGAYNPALKPKKKKKKELEKIKKMQQKLFDWRPEKFIGERSKHERVVIIKNLFHPSDFDNEVQLILDYQQDLREESAKCGEVRKVVIYDRHPEGVAQITMKEPEEADAVVQLINGRWFGKRQITAEIWDGRTKYRIAETDADISQRRDKWDNFLEGKQDKGESTEIIKSNKDSENTSIEQKTDEKTNLQTSSVSKECENS